MTAEHAILAGGCFQGNHVGSSCREGCESVTRVKAALPNTPCAGIRVQRRGGAAFMALGLE